MQKELNHKVRKCFNEGIYNVARYTEIVLSIIILIVNSFNSSRFGINWT